MNTGPRAFLLGIILSCYRPAVRGSVWQWAEQNVVLTRKQSPGNPGPFRSDLNPYTRTVADFILDPNWDELIIKKSSQSGFTEMVLNAVRFIVAEKPTNILYMLDSASEAKKVCATRLEPTIRKFIPPELIEMVGDDKLQTLMLDLPHMTIFFAGGYSGGAAANKPCGLVVVDEMDEHPAPKAQDSESIDQGRERLKSVDDGKLIGLGRPKLETGVTCREHANGTCEVLDVPCPHCGHFQELTRKGLRYEHCKDMLGEYDLERVLAETYFACGNPACTTICPSGEGKIRDEHRYEMNLAGRWRVTNPKHKPRKRSIHISDLYSPFATFGEIAVEHVEAKRAGNQKKLQAVYNNRYGLGWKQSKAEVKEADVLNLRGPYKRGACPFPRRETALITVQVDKQEDVFKAMRCGFRQNGEMAVIDWKIIGSEEELLDWSHLPVTTFAGETWPAGEGWPANLGIIDEGFQAKISVRDFIQRSEGFFHGSKGRGGLVQVKGTVWESKTMHKDVEMIVYHFDDDDFKKQLYIERIAKLAKIKSGESRTPRAWLPDDCDEELVRELWAERLVEKKTPLGFSKWEWEKVSANDFGDALKMGLVVWHVVGHFLQNPPPPEEDSAAEEEKAAA